MQITGVDDIKNAAGEMHDSEFTGEDFGYNFQNKTFSIRSRTPDNLKEFLLEIYNVEDYKPLNLDKVNKGQATSGVLNTIDVHNKGLSLEIIGQDLRIKLRLSKLAGNFIQVTKK